MIINEKIDDELTLYLQSSNNAGINPHRKKKQYRKLKLKFVSLEEAILSKQIFNVKLMPKRILKP